MVARMWATQVQNDRDLRNRRTACRSPPRRVLRLHGMSFAFSVYPPPPRHVVRLRGMSFAFSVYPPRPPGAVNTMVGNAPHHWPRCEGPGQLLPWWLGAAA